MYYFIAETSKNILESTVLKGAIVKYENFIITTNPLSSQFSLGKLNFKLFKIFPQENSESGGGEEKRKRGSDESCQ